MSNLNKNPLKVDNTGNIVDKDDNILANMAGNLLFLEDQTISYARKKQLIEWCCELITLYMDDSIDNNYTKK